MELGVAEAVDPATERGEPVSAAIWRAHEGRHRRDRDADPDRRRSVVANDRDRRGRQPDGGSEPYALASPKV